MTVPRLVGTVVALRFCTWPGLVNGTTVLLDRRGRAGPALRSLTATTVNAYCVPYSSEPAAIVMVVPVTRRPARCAPSVTDVTVYAIDAAAPGRWPPARSPSTVPSGLAVAVTEVGASGTSAVGVTGGLLAPSGRRPILLTACTVNR